MNYLAIDTSGTHLTIILNINGKITKKYIEKCGTVHSNILLVETEALINSSDATLKDVDLFACVTGAGSFTGIRIGVATIKAFCFALDKPCLAITSFDTIAYNKQEKAIAVIDAKHDNFYVCGYDENRRVEIEPCFVTKDELLEMAKGYKLLSGFSIDGLETEVVSVENGLINAIEEKKTQATKEYDTLAPLYVRKSQAEENR